MFKFSDIKVGDVLINNKMEDEFKVLAIRICENAYHLCIRSLKTKEKYFVRTREGDEAKFGLAKIVHA